MFPKRYAGHNYFLLVQHVPELHQGINHPPRSDLFGRHPGFHAALGSKRPVQPSHLLFNFAQALDQPGNVTAQLNRLSEVAGFLLELLPLPPQALGCSDGTLSLHCLDPAPDLFLAALDDLVDPLEHPLFDGEQ